MLWLPFDYLGRTGVGQIASVNGNGHSAGDWAVKEPSKSFAPNQNDGTAPSAFTSQAGAMDYVKNILVPTNFSPCADRAFQQALVLAQECKAVVTLLFVVDISANIQGWGPADPDRVAEELRAKALDQFRRILSHLPHNVEVNTLIREGLPYEEIAEAAQDYDVVVIGKSRPKPFWRLFSRRTFDGVLDLVTCPLLVVEEGKSEWINQGKLTQAHATAAGSCPLEGLGTGSQNTSMASDLENL